MLWHLSNEFERKMPQQGTNADETRDKIKRGNITNLIIDVFLGVYTVQQGFPKLTKTRKYCLEFDLCSNTTLSTFTGRNDETSSTDSGKTLNQIRIKETLKSGKHLSF